MIKLILDFGNIKKQIYEEQCAHRAKLFSVCAYCTATKLIFIFTKLKYIFQGNAIINLLIIRR